MLPPLTLAILAVAPAVPQSVAKPLPIETPCGVVLSAVGPPCPAGTVPLTGGWFGGDTHEHIQQCFSSTDVKPPSIYQDMLETNLHVSNPLIWGAGFITPAEFQAYLALYVTGFEDPATSADASHVIWCGIETSGVSAGNLGHMIGLHVTPEVANVFQLGLGCLPHWPAPGWQNDGSGDWSKPVLDLLRQADGAVTGYAHQTWPVDLYADPSAGGFAWEDPLMPAYVGHDAVCSAGKALAFPLPKTCGNTHPVLAPFDVALGRIDFLEAFELLEPTDCGPLEKRYFGMYYRLLNAGQRVSLTAGTDADCIGLACPPRVYVKLEDGQSFTYDAWTQALARGRTSLASGPYQLLDVTVQGASPGDTVAVAKPGSGTATVHVKATYNVRITDGSTISDAIEIVQDGEVIASEAFGPTSIGKHTFHVDVPVTRSGWIAARTKSYGTHTAAVYVRYDGRPTANCADAEYWTLYADFLNFNLDVAEASGSATLAYYTGCSEDEIRAYIAQGRDIYAAIRDYDAEQLDGILRYGKASPPACLEPAALVTSDVPKVGAPFRLRWFNAPPGGIGGIVTATTPLPLGVPLLGATLHVLPNPALAPLPAFADEGGYGELTLPALPSNSGLVAYLQGVWVTPPGCDPSSILTTSDALRVEIQP